MRFALVGPAPPFRGGIAKHTEAVCRALAGRHEVVLHPFARQYPRLLFPGRSQLAGEGGRAPPAGRAFDPYSVRSWRAVARAIADACPDLVLIQWWHPWFAVPTAGLLAMLRRRLGDRSRLALLSHNLYPHAPVPLQRSLARMVLRRTGTVIVHAATEADGVRGLVPGTAVHRMSLPCLAPGGDPPGRAAARAMLDLGDRPWILFFGYVRPHKGLADLVDAVARARTPGVGLVVAGEFYEPVDRFRDQVERLALPDRVRLVDRFVRESEIPVLFAAADLVVLPYRAATQSSVLPLAIRYRRRLVVTDVGGLAEAAGGIGTVVPPESPERLAAAIDAALAAPPPGEEAFARAERRFSLATVRTCLEEIAEGCRVG